MSKLIISRVWKLIFEGEDTTPGSEGTDTVVASTGNDKTIQFTPEQQEHINGLLKKERSETAKKEAVKVEQALKSKNLSDKQRNELTTQLDNLRSTYLTKEQQAQEALEREKTQAKERETAIGGERDLWRNRYTDSTISRSIADAAIEEDAYDPIQLEALLKSNTQLVEELDEQGKPNGRLIPKTKFVDSDKEGKELILEISPHEAVKKMRGMKRFENLFRTKAAGGLGGTSRSSGVKGVLDVETLAKDPVAYREARKKGLIQ